MSEAGDGLAHLSLAQQDVTKIRQDIIWIESQRSVTARHRIIQLTKARQRNAEINVRYAIIRLDGQCSAIARNRLIEPPEFR